MADNILTVVRDRLRLIMNDEADNVATGACLSGDDATMIPVKYARNVGVIEGLAMAERCILDVLDEIEKREELDT